MSLLKELEVYFSDSEFNELSVNDEYALFIVDRLSPNKITGLVAIAYRFGFEINIDVSLEFAVGRLEIELTKKETVKSVFVDVDVINNTPNDMELGKAVRVMYEKQIS